MSHPIPITILTGFLGSGKTTLLNHILRTFPDKKIAIVENEFGSEGIDGGLVERSSEEIVEISSGCICCTVRKDFLDAVERLLSSGREIDWIIIEASGMSEPLPIAQSFLMQDMGKRVKLDSIVCLVDADSLTEKLMQDIRAVVEQLEFADMVVINKTDLVERKFVDQIREVVRRVNYHGAIIEASHGQVDRRYLFDTSRFELTDDIEAGMHEHDAHGHSHESSITSFCYKTDREFDARELTRFFEDLDQDVFRAKGFFRIAEHTGWFVLQKA